MERNTLQKSVIYDTAISMNHPSADEVFAEIHKKYAGISRSTVYRVLNGLAESGRLRKLYMGTTADRFDFSLDEHTHVVCRKCGRVADVARKGFEVVKNPPENLSGYIIDNVNITYSGLCPKCINNNLGGN